MRSQFKPKLKVDAGTGEVEAKGEFTWGPGEEKAVVDVTILEEWQPGSPTKFGTGKAVFMQSSAGSDWDLKVASQPAPENLVPGKKALAMGVVCALGTNIEMRQFIWCQEIDLIP